MKSVRRMSETTDPPALPRTPSLRLDGRRALVTGGSRGIGLAAAAALAQAGAEVWLCARGEAELEAAAGLLRQEGAAVVTRILDVADLDAAAHLVAAAPAFDVLVNNAGMNRPAPFLEVRVEDYDQVMAVNVRATFFLAQAVAGRMVEAGVRGSIINVSSQMGRVGGARRTVYCATKWALEGLTRAMAIELGAHGIRVNTICPTFIETVLARQSLADPVYRAHVMDKIRLGRLGRVEDVMGAVLLLASDASAMMTGSSLMVDGGWTAG